MKTKLNIKKAAKTVMFILGVALIVLSCADDERPLREFLIIHSMLFAGGLCAFYVEDKIQLTNQ